MIRTIIVCLFLSACSSPKKFQTRKDDNTRFYNYTDGNGSYAIRRDNKLSGNKLVTRNQLSTYNGAEVLEKSITVSKVGKISGGSIAVLPESSQFEVWFSGKKYVSKIKINRNDKMAIIYMQSPEKKWNGTKTQKLNSSRIICFFSQLPECLKMQNVLIHAKDKKVPLQIIWDNYPFHIELYKGLNQELITQGAFYFSDKVDDLLRFELDIGNQIIFYHYDRALDFVKMNWVAQGITQEANINGAKN